MSDKKTHPLLEIFQNKEGLIRETRTEAGLKALIDAVMEIDRLVEEDLGNGYDGDNKYNLEICEVSEYIENKYCKRRYDFRTRLEERCGGDFPMFLRLGRQLRMSYKLTGLFLNSKQLDELTAPPVDQKTGRPLSLDLFADGGPEYVDEEDEEEDDLPSFLTDLASSDAQPAVLFRDSEISQAFLSLASFRSPNALLVGPSGCGKSCIAKEMARLIATNSSNVPEVLRGHRMLELNLISLFSNANFVGDAESRIKDLIDYLERPENRGVVLFIDEIHRLISAGSKSSDVTAAKLTEALKPALASGSIRVLGATTTQEASAFLANPAFKRRFSEVVVPELSLNQTAEIIHVSKALYSRHHGVSLPDNLESRLVSIADKCSTAGSHRPDNALALMDRCMALAALEAHPVAGAFVTVPAVTETHMEKAADLMLGGKGVLSEDKVSALRKLVDENIIGQDAAKSIIYDAVKRKTLGAFENRRPLSFLFAGPTGTGKTQIARFMAASLMGSERNFISLNMAEYSSPASVTRLLGSPEGYLGSDSNRELPLDNLCSNPRQIVLLDEFEKADREVQRLFLSALDDGVLTTNRGRALDFRQAIVIATTNAGFGTGAMQPLGLVKRDATARHTEDILKNTFEPELLNRFDHIVSFDPISRESYRDILVLKYNRLVAELSENLPQYAFSPMHLSDESKSKKLDLLVEETYSPLFNARPAERVMRRYIEDTIMTRLSKTQPRSGNTEKEPVKIKLV